MSLHDIHSCSKICAENVELRQKLAYIKRKKDDTQRQLDELRKSGDLGHQTCSKPAMKVASVQTDTRPWSLCYHRQEVDSKKTTKADMNQINKALEMHSNLLKRYDREVKLNMTYADTISDLNIKLAEMERLLREAKETNIKLERELVNAREKMAKCAEAEDPVLRDVLRERNRLAKENKKLRGELKSLDLGFFEEIEDLKYALVCSAKLNDEYEKSLRKLCSQFGVPFVAPCRVTGKLKTEDRQHRSYQRVSQKKDAVLSEGK